ncbi:MAG TPA: SRPBCC family protein [Gemmatimonadales bacterium]|nr:SRPBCC family protein [Gemmatimonadales bacterium]
MRRWLLVGIGVVAAAALAVVAIGLALPRAHVAAASRTVTGAPGAVWATVVDFERYPTWHPDVVRVEREAVAGRETWRETYRGGETVRYETTEADPPRRLVRTIADPDGPFRGRWEIRLEPAEGGTRVTITERGEVPNPVFRFVARFVIGHRAFMERFLDALARKHGTPPVAA